MNTDIRISVDFPTHHKTLKLVRRLGDGAPWALVRLWLYVAKHCPDGVLLDMDHEDIEIAAGWNGEEGKFVPALIDIRWLDLIDGVLSCHDWAEHNPWVSESENRGDKARFSRLFKTAAAICRELKAIGVDSIGKRDFSIIKAASTAQQSLSDIQDRLDIFNDRTTVVQRSYNDRATNVHKTFSPAPAPAPAPALKPKEEKTSSSPEIPKEKIAATSVEKTTHFSLMEFRDQFYRASGDVLPGGLNSRASELCMRLPRDRLAAAFQLMAECGGKTFRYLVKVLEDESYKRQSGRKRKVADVSEHNRRVADAFLGS